MSPPSPDTPLRIGARGSALALAQAREARNRLAARHGLSKLAFEIVAIKTTGDRVLDRPLSEIGNKGLFTKEIEDALLVGEIDLAVHSMKDVPTALPDGLEISAVLPRGDARDAFVSPNYANIAALPRGARVGSSSLRRCAQLLHRRPDLSVVGFRGNVKTRLKKLENDGADAAILACAGLHRLGLGRVIRSEIAPEDMLPACAQGVIGIETRCDDDTTHALLAPIHDEETAIRLEAERAFLATLDGSCRTPIGGLAELDGGRLRFRGEIIRPDGSERLTVERCGSAGDAAAMGIDAAEELRTRSGPGFFGR